MSWWPIPDAPDAVTGDPPADAAGTALDALVDERSRTGAGLPSVAEIAAALDAAAGRAGAAPPPDVATAVQEAVAEIVAVYEEDVGRRPSDLEVRYAFTFVLGGRPGHYVRDPPAEGRVRF